MVQRVSAVHRHDVRRRAALDQGGDVIAPVRQRLAHLPLVLRSIVNASGTATVVHERAAAALLTIGAADEFHRFRMRILK